jgi:CBS-domain-containing membrane protein
MWENDCGVVPVVDGDGRVAGMITDRDVCMAAYTQGRTLGRIPVSDVMATQVHGVRETDSLEVVETLMRRERVRRVPVLDGDGRLKGILSLNDLARHAHRSIGQKSNGVGGDSIAKTLAAVCEPRGGAAAKAEKRASIMSLLTDAEVAKISRAEEAPRLVEGDEYVDLGDLDSGVHQVQATSHVAMGRALPRSAVADATWAKIIRIV